MNTFNNSTVKKYEQILTVKNYSPRTVKCYSHYVARFSQHFKENLYHVNNTQVREFFYNYKFSSIAEQNQYINAVKLFCKYILEKDIDKIRLERPRKEKHLPCIIDQEELLTKIKAIQNIKHKAIISVAYSVGLRVSEIINMQIKDIDSARMIINIKNAKGRKDRIVPLSQNILILLRVYYKEYKPSVYLFEGQFKEQYSPVSCNQIVKKYLGKSYHFHLLRHSCFTHLLESGTDLRIIQTIAGHNSSKTTEIYTHVSNNILSKVKLPI
jgi:site-specific recombinase XerD